MPSRVKKIRRIVKAQEQLKIAEEWRLRSLESQLAEAEISERELLASLDADSEIGRAHV